MQRLTDFAHRVYTPKFLLFLFTMTNFITYYDRGAISASLTNIRTDSTIVGGSGTISETAGGFVVSAFMIGYMIACPIFASLGKWFSAKSLIVVGVLIWAAACFCTGLAQSYGMLVATRMFVGVGEAAFVGFFVTIIDNVAPPASRTAWIGIFYSMIPVGTAIGMAGSGAIASKASLGAIVGWRLVFFSEVIVSAPVIVLIALMPAKYNPNETVPIPCVAGALNEDGDLVGGDSNSRDENTPLFGNSQVNSSVNKPRQSTMSDASLATCEVEGGNKKTSQVLSSDSLNEDHRHNHDREEEYIQNAGITDITAGENLDREYSDPITALKNILLNIDFICIVVGYGMYVFVTGSVAVFAIPMLTHGPWKMSQIGASSMIGGVVAITGLLGSIVGGIFVDKSGGSTGLSGSFKSMVFSMLMIVICIPVCIGAMYVYEMGAFLTLYVVGVFCLFAVTAPVNAAILTSVDMATRTYAISFSVFFIHLIGDFPSPTITGALSDAFDKGCADWKNEGNCTTVSAVKSDCIWVPPKDDSNGFCTNEYEIRNALVIVFFFLAIAIPSWGVVAFRALRKVHRDGETIVWFVKKGAAEYVEGDSIQKENVEGTTTQ